MIDFWIISLFLILLPVGAEAACCKTDMGELICPGIVKDKICIPEPPPGSCPDWICGGGAFDRDSPFASDWVPISVWPGNSMERKATIDAFINSIKSVDIPSHPDMVSDPVENETARQYLETARQNLERLRQYSEIHSNSPEAYGQILNSYKQGIIEYRQAVSELRPKR